MPKSQVETYLDNLERELRKDGSFYAENLEEIGGHLYEAVDDGLRSGLNLAEAEAEALRRFGPVDIVSLAYKRERTNTMQTLLLGIATVSGLFITYVDSRPHWDDTGITAGIILLVTGLIGLAGYKRPWLLGLAVGAWIPLYGILVTHNYGSILALIIAFIGAYAGWGVHLAIRKILTPT